LTCTGAGGTANQSVALTVPIPVQKSSYLNAKNINIPAEAIPTGIGFVSSEYITSGVAYGDFFQDGTVAMVAVSSILNGTNGFGSTTPGRVYFFHADGKGGWIDQTTKLVSSQTGCLSPRKLLVADFNGDGIPDVFISCHGIDGNIPPGFTAGDHPRVLLSQANGTYTNTALSINCYCHGAAAADVNGNGYADVVVVDPLVHGAPFYLVNNKDGTFTPDYTRMPPATAATFNQCDPACGLGIFSVELIDFNGTGKFDLWFGGVDNGKNQTFAASIFKNPGNNNWTNATRVTLPSATGAAVADTLPLDIIFTNGNIYMLRVSSDYNEESIQKINYATLVSSTLYMHSGPYPNANGSSGFAWMLPYQGNIISLDPEYGVSIPQ